MRCAETIADEIALGRAQQTLTAFERALEEEVAEARVSREGDRLRVEAPGLRRAMLGNGRLRAVLGGMR